MSALLNQYSFVVIILALVGAAGAVLLTRRPRWNDYLAFFVILGGLIAAWLILHPRQTPLMGDARHVQEAIGAGTPVLLEFQSPYCVACTAIKPVVDELESGLAGRLRVIRLDIQQPAGRELAPVYRFAFTPTFIFFDAHGNELWRQVGTLDAQRVRDSVK
ncbi:MAG: thioredoxin family protein [Bacteroidota bacterium]